MSKSWSTYSAIYFFVNACERENKKIYSTKENCRKKNFFFLFYIFLMRVSAKKFFSQSAKEFWELNLSIIQYISISSSVYLFVLLLIPFALPCLHQRETIERKWKRKKKMFRLSLASVCVYVYNIKNNTRFLWLLLRRRRLHFHWLLEFWVNTRKMMNSGDLISHEFRSFWVTGFRASAFKFYNALPCFRKYMDTKSFPNKP